MSESTTKDVTEAPEVEKKEEKPVEEKPLEEKPAEVKPAEEPARKDSTDDKHHPHHEYPEG